MKCLLQISMKIILFALRFQIQRFDAFCFFLPIKVIEFSFSVTVESNGKHDRSQVLKKITQI